MPGVENGAPVATQLVAIRNDHRFRFGRLEPIEAARRYAADVVDTWRRHVVEIATAQQLDPASMAVVALGEFARSGLNPRAPLAIGVIAPALPAADAPSPVAAFLNVVRRTNPMAIVRMWSPASLDDDLAQAPRRALDFVDAPLLWGDEALHASMAEIGERRRLASPRAIVDALAADVAARHQRAGGTVYLLEPDATFSPGALADVATLEELAWVATGTASIEALADAGLLARERIDALVTARAFLVAMSNEMAFAFDAPRDQLKFAAQMDLSARLGYVPSDNALPEEQLMRDYYRHATEVHKALARVLRESTRDAAADAAHAKLPALMWRTGFPVRDGRVALGDAPPGALDAGTDWALPLMATACRHGLAFDDESLAHIEAVGARFDDAARSSASNRVAFFDLLGDVRRGGRTLRLMHEVGLLDAYLPEFALVRHLPRIDHYHQFALDEHMLRCVETAMALRDGGSPLARTHAASVARDVLRFDLLAMAALLHDVGKGEGRGHVARGARMIEEAAVRMGLPRRDIDLLRQLVLAHHRMSHIALTQDLEDPDIDEELVDAIIDPELLRMLYVLTVCDVRSVSTEAWNDWRGSLLAGLYEKAAARVARRLGIADQPELRNSMIVRVLDAVRAAPHDTNADGAIPNLGGGDVARFLGTLPEAYRIVTPENQVARHLALSRRVTLERPMACQVVDDANGGGMVVHAMARDCPGLLHQLCCAFSAAKLVLTSFHAFTSTTGFAVCVFHMKRPANPAASTQALMGYLARLESFVRGGTIPSWPAMNPATREPVSLARLLARPVAVELLPHKHHEAGTTLQVSAPFFADMPRTVAMVIDQHQVQILRARFDLDSYHGVAVLQVCDWENNPVNPTKTGARLVAALETALAPPQTINSSAAIAKPVF